jgi:hypothetical protein
MIDFRVFSCGSQEPFTAEQTIEPPRTQEDKEREDFTAKNAKNAKKIKKVSKFKS